MLEYETSPASKLHFIGLGSFGTNMLEQLTKLVPPSEQIGYYALDKEEILAHPFSGTKMVISPENLNEEYIARECKAIFDADILFLITGTGNNLTGAKLCAMIAKLNQAPKARRSLTLAIPVMPFKFEGHTSRKRAQTALDNIAQYADNIFLLENDQKEALGIDSLMEFNQHLAKKLSDLAYFYLDTLNSPGVVNLDFADVYAVCGNTKFIQFFYGKAQGEDRANRALQQALKHPAKLGHQLIIFSILSGFDLELPELETVMVKIDHISNLSHPNNKASVLCGTVCSPDIENLFGVSILTDDIRFSPKTDPEKRSVWYSEMAQNPLYSEK